MLEGRRVEKDTLIRLDDAQLISELAYVGKIAAGDDATRRRLGTHELISWHPAPDPPESRNPWQPAVVGGLALAGRRN